MPSIDVVRAWKDEEYLLSLSAEDRFTVPDNPAGVLKLPGEGQANAGDELIPITDTTGILSILCCPTWWICTDIGSACG